MRKIITLLVVLGWSIITCAQIDNPQELDQLLQGKKNYREIVGIVQNYYQDELAALTPRDSLEKKLINRQLKMWHRWKFYHEGHLDAQGNITNATLRNFEAMEELPPLIETSYGLWSPIGPNTYNRFPDGHNGGLGRVNCIAFHPTNPNILYIGTPAGGLWRSTNGGTNWTVLTDDIPSIGVSGIVIDPNDPNIIYILTGDGDGNDRKCFGVMKSTDGGSNWFFTGDFPDAPPEGFRGYKMVQHPTNANILFVVCELGIYKTINGGTTWTVEQTGWFSDIEFKPGDPTIMYAARINSSIPFLRSTNSGNTWTTSGVTGVPTNATRIAIGVSEDNPAYVYFLAGPATGSGTYVGVYRSFDNGLGFQLRNSAPNLLGYPTNGSDNRHQTNYDLAIEVSPLNHAIVLTGGINVWRSTNFGVDFSNATEWFEPTSPVDKYVHADIHNLAYNPLNNWLYVCSDGGVSVSTDHGVNWTQKWNTLQLAQYYSMSTYEANQNRILGGLQDNGTMYKKASSSTFDHVEGADGYQTLIDYTDPAIIYFDENDNLRFSTDDGNTVNNAGLSGDSWPALAMHSTNHNIIFAGRSNGIYKRNFSAGGWVNGGGAGQNRLLTCPSNSSRVYAYDGSLLRRSDNEGVSWSPTDPPTNPPSTQPLRDMEVNPGNSLNLFVCVGGYTAGQKVYSSTNGGATWTNISGTLPNAACGAITVDNNLGLYVGTDIGVFYRPSGGTWQPFYNFLPKVPITDLYVNPTAGTLTASTFGRGLWRTDVYDPCVPTLTLAGVATGNRFYQVSDNLQSTHNIQGGDGTEFFYKAGSYVQLNPGFEVKAGNKLKAFIGNCGTGIPTFRALNSEYGITDSKMLIASPLDTVVSGPVSSKLFTNLVTNGIRDLQFNLPAPQFIQVYYERESDHEIIAWVMRGSIKKGAYTIQLTDDALKNKGIKLVVHTGENKEEIKL